MAKDDYDVMACKILIYLYKKYKCMDVDDSYITPMTKDFPVQAKTLNETLIMMQEEGLIKGFHYIKAWGGDDIIILNSSIKITPSGVHYMRENSLIRKIIETLPEAASVASLFM